ncbi:MAG: DUF4292 domain-containing protein [Ginsengibacter sp.]
MQEILKIWFASIAVIFMVSACRSTKKLNTAVNQKDTTISIDGSARKDDSLAAATNVLKALKNHKIDYNTFSAKIKVEYEDSKGKQPEFNAFIRMKKDSIIWVSVSATFLSIEAFKILITPDSIVIVNKLDKQVEYHPFKYMEDITHIPMNFSILQDLLVGNPIYVGDSVVAYRQTENHILISTVGDFFKNLITVSADNNLIERCKLDDLDVNQNRTADITYGDYEKVTKSYFATSREITVAEKTKVDINLSYKQYEFNKELSYKFIIPSGYRMK